MSEKQKINLDENEIKITAHVHKKIMEIFGENCNFISKEKEFHVVTLSMAITLCNIMDSYKIDFTEKYMNDLSCLVEKLRKDVKQSSSYMEYSKGKKISEGRFN